MKVNLDENRNYIVTFFSDKTSKIVGSEVWNPKQPLIFGQPIRWVLEKNKDGVRVRYFKNSPMNKVVDSKFEEFSFEEIQKKQFIKVLNFKLRIHPIHQISDFKSDPELLKWIPKIVPIDGIGEVQEQLEESRFKKLFLQTVSGVALLMVISYFIPKPQPTPEEEIPPQFAKILLSPISKASQSANPKPDQTKTLKPGNIVQAFQGEKLQKSARKLVSGGALALLARSNLINGDILKTQVNELFEANSKSDQSALSKPSNHLLKKIDLGTLGQGDADAAKGDVSYVAGKKAGVQGQGNTFVTFDTRDVSVDEGLTQDEVGLVIHSHLPEVRFCYESAILRDPATEGKMIVEFKINKAGIVDTAAVKQPSITDPILESCIMKHLKSWKFPKPKGDIEVGVSYPFVFKVLGQ